MGNEIILDPPEPIEDIPVTEAIGENQAQEKKKKHDKPPKKPLRLILNLLIITLLGITATEIYFRLDRKFKEQQDYINEHFAESVNLMTEEYEKDNYVRGLHDLKDPYEGWERYIYHSLSFRYPPEISTQHTTLRNHGCDYSSSHIDFISDELRQLYNNVAPEGTEEEIAEFYGKAFGMTICHFPNSDNLNLIDFVLAENTWLPNTTTYNSKSDRTRITRNWINANVDRTLEGYIFKGKVTTDKPTTILFLQERDDKTTYIFEMDQNYASPDNDTSEELRNLFDRILTSINWRVR